MVFKGRYESPHDPGLVLAPFLPKHHMQLLLACIEDNAYTLDDADRSRARAVFEGVADAPDAWLFAGERDGECMGIVYLTKIQAGLNAWLHAYGVKGVCNASTATRFIRVLLDLAFNAWALVRVSTEHALGNRLATLICMRAGFQQEGIIRQARLQNGKPHDVWVGGILREEWANGRRR